MIRHYCDCCEQEITSENEAKGGFNTADRLGAMIQRNGVQLKVEVLTTKNGTANDGDFCKHCILDALYRLDDRPQAGPPLEVVK